MPRHPKHDYRRPCTYHITLKKLPTLPDFSVITGCPESWYVYHPPIGKAIQQSIVAIEKENPKLKVYRYAIMPDHVHILIRALEYLERPLGIYISKIKIKALQNTRLYGLSYESLFEKDFYDRILRLDQSLDTVIKYIYHNPYRLLVRKFYPDYFRRINNVFYYKDIHWAAYGNLQLLGNPFRDAVVCHRADAGTRKEDSLIKNWLHLASNGGVLISPFIAQKEKEIREKAEAANGKIILISNKAFGERYKPAAHDFHQCESGSLLIIAPITELPECRRTFLFLNGLAEDLALGRIL